MAKDFYQQMQDIAQPILKQFKQGTVQIRRTVEGPRDPLRPYEPGPTTTKILELYATVSGVNKYQIDGTQIQASDQVVTCAARDSTGQLIDPQETDVLLIDGEARQIKKIQANPAAGIPVTYAIFVAG
jgi:hypothetical protein